MKISRRENTRRLNALPIQGSALTKAAVERIRRFKGPNLPLLCQRYIRLTVQEALGADYDMFWRGTASKTGVAFRQSVHAVAPNDGSIPGDILYKFSGYGGFGHGGIRVWGNMVAENASVHFDGKSALGLRTLQEFGDFDLIVRLR